MTLKEARRAPGYENPREDVQALVPAGARRVLELGCATGLLGAALKARQGAEVVGVEVDPAYAREAAERLDRVVEADVEAMFAGGAAAAEAVGRLGGPFDCLIAADVLEHLRDPWSVLRGAAALLEPGGHAVLSLPNVRYWETFFQLGVRGRWPRRDFGIFDRTHLRWFTLADARALAEQAGLEMVRIVPQYRLRPPKGPDRRSPARRAADGLGIEPPHTLRALRNTLHASARNLIHPTPLRPLFAHQYLLLTIRPNDPETAAAYRRQPQTAEELQGLDQTTRALIEEEPWALRKLDMLQARGAAGYSTH